MLLLHLKKYIHLKPNINMKTYFQVLLRLLSLLIIFVACSKTESTPDPVGTATTSNYATIMQNAFKDYGAANVTVAVDGNFLTVTTTTVPDHKSPYFAGTDSRFENYNGTNTAFKKAPNTITEGKTTLRIPTNPTKATSAQATPMGPFGVSLNGVPFFNQYAAGGSPLTGEINGFDQYGGHPQQQGQYHYHVEPLYITAKKGKGALLGFLLDGFPVYGPLENSKTIKSSDLDAYHGHSHATTEYPNGIYHYHITADDPYINGSGFYGTPGTLTK